MEARAKILGHPIHQMLIPFPIGLLITAVVLDIISMFVQAEMLTIVSFWNLSIGIGMGLVAAVFGLIDWTGIPRGTRAKRVGLMHAGLNVLAILLYLGSIAIRFDEPAFAVPAGALVLEIGGLALTAAAGWLGGELVDRLAIGIDPHAHPDHGGRGERRRPERAPVRPTPTPTPRAPGPGVA
jgi:uncharacterized membrane protein